MHRYKGIIKSIAYEVSAAGRLKVIAAVPIFKHWVTLCMHNSKLDTFW